MTLDTYVPGAFTYRKVSDNYFITSDVCSILTAHKGGKSYIINPTLKVGFRSDGASVPYLLTWFLPRWDKKNPAYNMAAMIHDALYANRGYGYFTREECDDLYRGMLRNCGISRLKAGLVDKSIELFAGSKRHWGNIEYNAGLSFIKVTERN